MVKTKTSNEFANSVMAKIRANDNESRTLVALRDTLLLNGRAVMCRRGNYRGKQYVDY